MAGGCGLPTAFHTVERAEIAIGDSVLVLGAGPVGLSAVALARARGATRVLVIGGPANRLATAVTMGADAALDLTGRDVEQREAWVREQTEDRGADVVIEATGVPDAVTQAMWFARDAGRVVVVGQYTNAGETTFNPHLDLNQKHLDVRGVWGCDFSHLHRSLDYLRHGALQSAWDAIPLESFGLTRAQAALDAVARGQVVKALIEPALR
jgi:L-iditol 2-dehydrogenase